MSDGERSAFYLIARVLDAPDGIVIVDETELHLHPVLARRLWNSLEKERPQCRFVYITHDVPFALSRNNADYLVLRPNKEPELLSGSNDLPRSVVSDILGAATFSVTASRIIFCEGETNDSIDERFYLSWFSSEETVVIPVGSCREVIQCVRVFRGEYATSGFVAEGVIDSDYHPDEYFDALPDGVHRLPLHEVESLLCTRAIFGAVASDVRGWNEKQIGRKYAQFFDQAVKKFDARYLNYVALERAKRRADHRLLGLVNGVEPEEDWSAVEAAFTQALNPKSFGFTPGDVLKEERERVDNAIKSKDDDTLRILPGKPLISVAAKTVGVETDVYIEKAVTLIKSEEGEELCKELKQYLPPR